MNGFILFGTPHFRAGLAQWALITAKKLRIPCADRPRQQDWSELKKDLDQIAGMQTSFCDLNPGPKLACYFAVRPTIKPELVSQTKFLEFVQNNCLDAAILRVSPENIARVGHSPRRKIRTT